MKKTGIFKNLLYTFSAAVIMASCTQNEEVPNTQESEVTLTATVSSSTEPGARTASLVYNNLTITDLRLSLDDVKLNLRATSNDSNKPTIVHIRSGAPQVITLVKDGQIHDVLIGSAMAFNGVYGKLNFDLVKAVDVDEDDEMLGKSVIVKALWFDVPAVMYLDIEENVEVKFNQGIEVAGAQDFLLTLYMDKLLEGVDPSLVSDGNGDGLIEVGPNDEDGNGEAYAAILANIESALVMQNGKFKDK
ncbi:hypothetical protein [Negadavirga shengliensis]|uniref:DUF4382 domain-containing protein n=1 Tax=Negadavirga shengliensis TaxID=1389218 RepID=A0ABV9T9Z6_9BACT